MSTPSPRSKMLAWLFLLPVCGAVLVVSGCSTTENGSADNGHLVFCLSPAQRANLAAAAVSLGLAAHGSAPDQLVVNHSPTSLDDWERQDRTDFDRACDALVSSARVSTPPADNPNIFLTSLNVLYPLLIGAALGLLTSAYRDSVIRRRTQAEELESAVAQFIQTGDSFVREWAERGHPAPHAAPLRDVRWKLVTVLRRVSAVQPSWSALRETRELVEGPRLGEQLLHDWEPLDDGEREARAQSLSADWQRLADAVDDITGVLRKPRWQRQVPRFPAVAGPTDRQNGTVTPL